MNLLTQGQIPEATGSKVTCRGESQGDSQSSLVDLSSSKFSYFDMRGLYISLYIRPLAPTFSVLEY